MKLLVPSDSKFAWRAAWVLCRDCIPSATSQLLSLLVLPLPTCLEASKTVPPRNWDRQTPSCDRDVAAQRRGQPVGRGITAAIGGTIALLLSENQAMRKNPRCFWVKPRLTLVAQPPPGALVTMVIWRSESHSPRSAHHLCNSPLCKK